MSDDEKLLSIGDLAEASGLSVFAIRQWERRYGSPKAIKLESGHRRYPHEELVRIKLITKIMKYGYRASKVANLSYEEAAELLNKHAGEGDLHPLLEEWINHVKNWDSENLELVFLKEWKVLGPYKFLTERVVPFLARVGEAWKHKEISVPQEHFFSELLQSFMANYWRSNVQANHEPTEIIFATLEEEKHFLGLHMCAVLATSMRKKFVFLGNPAPLKDIIHTSSILKPKYICLSISATYPKPKAFRLLTELSENLPPGVKIIVGGQGAPAEIKNIINLTSLHQFHDWLEKN